MKAARPVQSRFLHEIAKDIRDDWQGMPLDAVVLTGALSNANWIDDTVNGVSARMVIMRLLPKTTGWKGDKAKRIKNELKALCGMR